MEKEKELTTNVSNKRQQVGRIIDVSQTDEQSEAERKRTVAKTKKQKQKHYINMVKAEMFCAENWTEQLFLSRPDSKINLFEDNLKLKQQMTQ